MLFCARRPVFIIISEVGGIDLMIYLLLKLLALFMQQRQVLLQAEAKSARSYNCSGDI